MAMTSLATEDLVLYASPRTVEVVSGSTRFTITINSDGTLRVTGGVEGRKDVNGIGVRPPEKAKATA